MVDTAHDWGYKPSEFGLCLEEDNLSVMSAFTATTSRMRGWENDEQEREMEKHKPKGKRGRNV